MSNVSSQVPIVADSCNYCSLQSAHGIRTIYEDGIVEFCCNACGRKQHWGELEHSAHKAEESKSQRLHSQENKDRFVRERYDSQKTVYMQKKEEGEVLPNLAAINREFQFTQDPHFTPNEKDLTGETDKEFFPGEK